MGVKARAVIFGYICCCTIALFMLKPKKSAYNDLFEGKMASSDTTEKAIFEREMTSVHTTGNALFEREVTSSDTTENSKQSTEQASEEDLRHAVTGNATAKQPIMISVNYSDGSSCTKRLPNAIIIGVAKCGTDALLTFLGHHPSIARANGQWCGMKFKEVDFFSKVYSRGFGWYLDKCMPCSKSNQLTIEKSIYWESVESPSRIYEMNKNIKLILVIKEPVGRVVSMYSMLTRHKHGNISSFKSEILENGQIDDSSVTIRGFCYDTQMYKWLEKFTMDQILIVDGQTLAEQPFEELQKVESYLGLPKYFDEDKFVYNEKKGFYCFSADPTESPKCLSAGKGVPHPNIRTVMITKLQKYFKPHNEKFFEMIGRQFDWGY